MNKIKTTQVCSLIVMLMLGGCNNKYQNNSQTSVNDKNVSIVAVNAHKADMSAGIVTIDGKQVNLSEIPLPAKQASQLTITPKLLYVLAYEASGVENNFYISDLEPDIGKQSLDDILQTIRMTTGITDIPVQKKRFIGMRKDVDSEPIELISFFIKPLNDKDAVKIGNLLINKNYSFNFGIAKTDIVPFLKRPDNYYGSFVYQDQSLTLEPEILFTKNFQYKLMSDKLNECSSFMKTIDGTMYCYNQRDITDNAWENASNYFFAELEKQGYSVEEQAVKIKTYYDKIPAQTQIEKKKLIEAMVSKEADGSLPKTTFQTTYKKLFGNEYIK